MTCMRCRFVTRTIGSNMPPTPQFALGILVGPTITLVADSVSPHDTARPAAGCPWLSCLGLLLSQLIEPRITACRLVAQRYSIKHLTEQQSRTGPAGAVLPRAGCPISVQRHGAPAAARPGRRWLGTLARFACYVWLCSARTACDAAASQGMHCCCCCCYFAHSSATRHCWLCTPRYCRSGATFPSFVRHV